MKKIVKKKQTPGARKKGVFVANLGHEIIDTVARYFAPVVAIYGGVEKVLSMPPAWQRRDDDRALR